MSRSLTVNMTQGSVVAASQHTYLSNLSLRALSHILVDNLRLSVYHLSEHLKELTRFP